MTFLARSEHVYVTIFCIHRICAQLCPVRVTSKLLPFNSFGSNICLASNELNSNTKKRCRLKQFASNNSNNNNHKIDPIVVWRWKFGDRVRERAGRQTQTSAACNTHRKMIIGLLRAYLDHFKLWTPCNGPPGIGNRSHINALFWLCLGFQLVFYYFTSVFKVNRVESKFRMWSSCIESATFRTFFIRISTGFSRGIPHWTLQMEANHTIAMEHLFLRCGVDISTHLPAHLSRHFAVFHRGQRLWQSTYLRESIAPHGQQELFDFLLADADFSCLSFHCRFVWFKRAGICRGGNKILILLHVDMF